MHYFVLPLYIVNMFHFHLNVDLLLIIKTIKFEVCLNFCRYVLCKHKYRQYIQTYIFIGNICINDDRECTVRQLKVTTSFRQVSAQRLSFNKVCIKFQFLLKLDFHQVDMIDNAFKIIKKHQIDWQRVEKFSEIII